MEESEDSQKKKIHDVLMIFAMISNINTDAAGTPRSLSFWVFPRNPAKMFLKGSCDDSSAQSIEGCVGKRHAAFGVDVFPCTCVGASTNRI